MPKFCVFILLATLFDCGLCAIDVTCKEQAGFITYKSGKKLCYVDELSVSEYALKEFTVHVNYAEPKHIEEVYFSPSVEPDHTAIANDIKHILPGLFSAFPNLLELSMDTDLSKLNAGDFTNALNLTTLNLHDSNLQVIKNTVFASHPNDASTEELPLHKLKNIIFSHCNISEIEASSFHGLKSLKLLVLSYNGLNVVQRSVFASLERLTRLYLDNNQIETIEDGALDLPSLWLLDLSNNKLKQLGDNVFDHLPKLEIITLDNNELERIGHSLHFITSLQNISLSDNRIADINLSALAQMTRLRELSLKNSGFSFANADLPDDQEWNSPLVDLHLGNNNLSDAAELNKLRVFPNLQHLDVGENQLMNLDVGGNKMLEDVLPSLRTLTVKASQKQCESISRIETSSETPTLIEMGTGSGTLRFVC